MTDILIAGGGPAGLAASYYLRLRNKHAIVLESELSSGGVCRTLEFDGMRYDLGAHRLHNVHPDVTADTRLLLGDALQNVNVPSRVRYRGRWATFPLTPFGLLKTVGPVQTFASLAKILLSPNKATDTFLDDAEQKYSPEIAHAFLINYSEKLWGMPASTLSPSISGKRLNGLNMKSVLRDLLRVKSAEHLDGAFLYPKLGFGQITDALAATASTVKCGVRITKVFHKNRRIVSIADQTGEEYRCEHLISTVPITALLQSLVPTPPEKILHAAEALRFRHLRLAVIAVAEPIAFRSASLYFPEREIPFTRIYEPKNRSAAMAPPEKTCLVVEYPYFEGDETDRMSDDLLLNQTTDTIVQLGIVPARSVSRSTTRRVPNAYPVLTLKAEAALPGIKQYLSTFENLHLSGRCGLFEYSHFHDVMRRGKTLARTIY